MGRVKQRQLVFGFADSPQGSGRTGTKGLPEAKEWLLRTPKTKEPPSLTTPTADKNPLFEKVAWMPNLARALKAVVRNKGAAGVDGCSVEEVMEESQSILPKLQQALLQGKYRPGDIRRAWIRKPEGGQRGLGIPNVIDRIVQEAVLQVLEPIFDPSFHKSSHGFRPNRGAHSAIAEAQKYVAEGYRTVVDLDVAKFFDRVNHQRLLNRLAQRVKDGRVLKLIHGMLKAKVVLPDGVRVTVAEGTPQGGPLSPLLSNIVLDELDKELERRGLRFVRYADDCNIYVKSRRAGKRVMDSVRRFLEKRLRLQINEEKSSVTKPDRVHFLGFRFGISPNGKIQIHLSKRSIKRMYDRIRELTPRKWGQSLKACMEQVNSYLKGWEAYFRICTERGANIFERFDAHIRRRLRAIIIKQKKRARHLYRHLISRGVAGDAAAKCAFSRKGIWVRSNMLGINSAYKNEWFSKRLASLDDLWRRSQNRHTLGAGGQLILPFMQ